MHVLAGGLSWIAFALEGVAVQDASPSLTPKTVCSDFWVMQQTK